MSNLILIDGNPIMHRAYHALPPLTAADGTPTNILYGFFSMLYKIINDFKPEYFAVVFDTPKPTFRNKIFKDYQIQRPKIEDNFIVQIPLLKEAIDSAGIYRLEKDGYEADDVIGTICYIFKQNPQFKIIIVSGDKDIFQLINDNVYVATPIGGLSDIKIYNAQDVEQKLAVPPSYITDFKALAGDPSDNYPGAKGIGPVTASKLIKQFGDIDNIYKNLDKISSKKVREILEKEKENVYLSKKLATILTDAPIEIDIDKMRFTSFNKKLKDFLERYQIHSLVKRIFGEEKKEKKQEEKPKIEQNTLF
jgi:5'-3' exonuclease (including N-terminal domain of PolI)